MAYATVPELTDYLGTTPEGAQRMLDRASRLVDRALISSRYDPQAPAIVEALRTATLEQCAEWDASGADGTQASDPAQWGSVSAGPISLGGRRGTSGSGGAGSTVDRLTTQAYLVLQQAGLTGHAPRSGWC